MYMYMYNTWTGLCRDGVERFAVIVGYIWKELGFIDVALALLRCGTCQYVALWVMKCWKLPLKQ